MTPEHRRYDVVEISWSLARSALAEQLKLTEDVLAGVVSPQYVPTRVAVLIFPQEATLDEDELEECFIIERDSGEPDSEGRLTYPPEFHDVSAELDEQLKLFLKALKKAHPDAFDKRKRDEICGAVVAQALMAKLAQYHTTAEEDQALLKKSDLAERHRMAVEVRLGEKELLKEAIEMMQGPPSANDEGNGERATKRAKTQV